jgi:thymidylate kinase
VAEPAQPGQLISLDAVRSADLIPGAKRLLQERRIDANLSIWDSSSIFCELSGLHLEDPPSARTLLLLYTADLRFRLRWQILPALEGGGNVIAAPYVETAVAFGLGFGLPKNWMTELLGFAPTPAACYWLDGPPAAAPAAAGFIEFCAGILPKGFFEKFVRHFQELEREGKCRAVDS